MDQTAHSHCYCIAKDWTDCIVKLKSEFRFGVGLSVLRRDTDKRQEITLENHQFQYLPTSKLACAVVLEISARHLSTLQADYLVHARVPNCCILVLILVGSHSLL